jgi:hypothetical protein
MNHILAVIAAKIGPFLASGAGKLLLTQTGAAALIAIALRILPNEKLDAVCFGAGKSLSGLADLKLGKVFWEPVENFLENSLGVCLRGFFRGLDSDDDPPPAQ